jgi:hypothetical protein
MRKPRIRPPPRRRGVGHNKRNPRLRPYFTSKRGRRIWARDYGHEAWPIGR